MRVLFHYDAGPDLLQQLRALAREDLQIATCSQGDAAAFATAVRDAEVIWHVLEPITAQHIRSAPALKLIQKIGVGVNTIDLEAAKAGGVAVCNMPGTNSRAVAEMTLALMLAALRRLPYLDARTREGRGWELEPALQEGFGELAGRSVGLVGFGAVPALLAPILEAMGARVIYCARAPKDVPYAYRELHALLDEADVVSLHVPLTAQTDGLLDSRRIARMKPGAVLVNTARGALVDEDALVAALRSGHLRAAGLDVLAAEPAKAGHALFALPNVVLAPHLAWLTPETLARSLTVAVDNCRRLREGRDLVHRVA
jgi:phosphoglycerate dehydrogenase-like enzyme